MSDDLAAKRASTVSSSPEVVTLDVTYISSAFDALDESENTDGAVDSNHDETNWRAPSAAEAESVSNTQTIKASVKLILVPGVGDAHYLDWLMHALKDRCWEVDVTPYPAEGARHRPEPQLHPDPVGMKQVALGLGLGGARAMWQSWRGGSQLDGVVAVCPFLGFDAPIYRSAHRKSSSLAERALTLASKPGLLPLASRIECVSAYLGLGHFVTEAVSWADLADCAPSTSFASLMHAVRCPTLILLDADDPDLDQERARSQIPAMNALASVEVASLSADGFVDRVEQALLRLFGPHAGAMATGLAPAAGCH